MISMYRKKEILNYHILYGYGAKKIISQMRKDGKKPASRAVVRRLVNTYDTILQTAGEQAAAEYANSQEVYHTPERKRTKLDEAARKYIEECMERNRQKKLEGNRKQCMDLQRVWQILREEKGYDFCYSTVTAYAREYVARQEPPKSTVPSIRQYHPAGEECQFDWGEVKLKIHGKPMKLRMAVFALPHSNYRKAYLFIREHTLAFMESHRNYFHDIGRIPKRMVYDNMKVAVKSFVGTEKEPTDALLSMSNFYGFEFRFCNARKGNEKGNVEESVKVVRKFVFSVRDEFDSLDDAQAYLDKGCDKLNSEGRSMVTEDIVQLTQEDFSAMRPCTDDIACFELVDRQIRNYGVVTVEKAFYSVPDTLADSSVKARIYTNKIEVLHEGKVVAVHDKVGKGEWSIKLSHYLHTLRYKPGALKHSEALRQAPEGIRMVYEEGFANSPKEFISLLLFARDNDIAYDDIVAAYSRLKASHVSNITLQLMKAALKPETTPQQTVTAMIQQDAKAIEDNAQKDLCELAHIMNHRMNTNYATR